LSGDNPILERSKSKNQKQFNRSDYANFKSLYLSQKVDNFESQSRLNDLIKSSKNNKNNDEIHAIYKPSSNSKSQT
jgi:hypothetical protein